MHATLATLALAASFAAAPPTTTPAPAAPAPPAAPPAPAATTAAAEIDARIVREARGASSPAPSRLEHLCDRIGHRLSGSASLERALVWAQEMMRADGQENVRAEKVMVPHWVRGAESASIVSPVQAPLAVIGLGGSAGTGKRGVEGELVVVDTFAQLDALGARGVKDKIVLFNHKMPAWTEQHGSGYGEAAPFRGKGPALASKLGARAALVRSLTAVSLRSPHTGATRFEDGAKPLPAAAVSLEDAELLARLARAGDKVRVRLVLDDKTLPDVASANVVGELRGASKPEEIVLLGAHIDSWDVGQGAHDDGAGAVAVIEALRLLRVVGARPARTVRVALFTNEENGLRGAFAYAEAHAKSERHFAAIESDSGAGRVEGLGVENEAHVSAVAPWGKRIGAALADVKGAGRVEQGHSGADLIPLDANAVIKVGLDVDSSRYFDVHHSHADTFDKIDPAHLKDMSAALAIFALAAADAPALPAAPTAAPSTAPVSSAASPTATTAATPTAATPTAATPTAATPTAATPTAPTAQPAKHGGAR